MSIVHRREFQKLEFQALTLHQGEWKNEWADILFYSKLDQDG